MCLTCHQRHKFFVWLIIIAHNYFSVVLIHLCSVSVLSKVLRQTIENEEKLVNEIVLPGAKLEIREVS